MKIVNLIQGTPEWHAHRAQHWNASDAPAMMGCSPYMTRTELLSRLHTGISPEVDAATQRIFDEGHRFEALARPMAEEIIGEELYPVTGTDGRYSASFDGLTMLGDVAFEHKTLNANLSELVWLEDANDFLPAHYLIQMEHQAMVSGCERVLFMASKWAGDDLIEERHCWYLPDAELRAQIIAGWAQLDADLKCYEPRAVESLKPIGKAPSTLPALRIEVTGMVTASNLAEFKEIAIAAIRGVNRLLESDQDFADAEQSVKWCEDVEGRLKAAKEHALGQTASIDQLFKTIDDISAEARKVRLELDKLIKERKTEIRNQIVSTAVRALSEHVGKLLHRVGLSGGITTVNDFAGVIKGKRSLSSIQDAVDTELARAKIAANELADKMEANIKTLTGEAHDWRFLFPDLHAVAGKPAEDFANLLAARIAGHKQAEESRRQREADAAAKAAQVVERTAPVDSKAAPVVSPPAPVSTGDAETVKLGQINARLTPIQISAAGLSQLGFDPVGKDKSAVLYRESDFPFICQAIANHAMGAVAFA